jgi:hypothetical protein
VIDRASCPDFKHIVHAAVPSIFGYFSSDEHIVSAFDFYVLVVDLASPSLGVRILELFFNSVATFRFVEFALDKFFASFVFDYSVTPEEDRVQLLTSHGINLMACFIEAVPLLPDAHLRLLKHISEQKWPSNCFADLLFVRWLWPTTVKWLKGSPCPGEARYLNHVLGSVGKAKQEIRKFYRALFDSHSVFSAPQLFWGFDVHWLCCFVCVNDVGLVARMLDEQSLLPRSLSLSDFLDVDRDFQYYMFWCQIYPKAIDAQRRLDCTLIFPEGSNTLELLLMQRQRLCECRKWLDIVCANVTMLLAGELDYLQTHRNVPRDNNLKQLLYFRAFGDAAVGGLAQRLGDCAAKWDKMTQTARVAFDLRSLSKRPESLKKCVLSGIRMITHSEKIGWSRKFALFLQAMSQLEMVSRRPEFGAQMLCGVMAQFSGKAWIVPFMLFNAAMGDSPELLSEKERLVWVKFESCILLVLTSDQEALELFANQRSHLTAEFENFRKKVK